MAKKSKRKSQRNKVGSDKPCKLCKRKVTSVDWKDDTMLKQFVTDRGKIAPRRVTGTCAHHQRMLARAIKRARFMALLPFVKVYFR
ncbi:MAG: 30S ribosomal protein S18 [Candidatus Krumholzibacteriales bacterium]